MDIKPIRNEADYDAALAAIDALMDAEPGTPEGDRLDVLVTLVEAYEEAHWPIDPPDPIDALKGAMERRGLTRKDLEPLIGSRARVSEILNRRRHLTVPMVWRLHKELGIPAESLVRPYDLARSGDARRRRGGRSAAAMTGGACRPPCTIRPRSVPSRLQGAPSKVRPAPSKVHQAAPVHRVAGRS